MTLKGLYSTYLRVTYYLYPTIQHLSLASPSVSSFRFPYLTIIYLTLANLAGSYVSASFTPQYTYCIGSDLKYENPPSIKQCNGTQKQWSDLGVSSIVKTNVT